MRSLPAESPLYRRQLVGGLGDHTDDPVRPGTIDVWGHSVELPACLSIGFGVVIIDHIVLPLARPSQYPLFQLLVQYQYTTTGDAPRAAILPLDAALCCLNLLELPEILGLS
jgi:hypothetical protein